MRTSVPATFPRKNRDDNRRVWYLLLQIGVPGLYRREDSARHIAVVRNEVTQLGITIRCLDVKYGPQDNANGRYLFRFSQYKRDDAAATRLAEAFLYGMSLVQGSMVESHHDSLLIPVPHIMLCRARSVQLEDLVALEERRSPDERSLDFPRATISTVSWTTPDRHEAAWRIAASTFNNDALFDATRFLKRSHDNFYVYPGQIVEVSSDTNAVPRTSSHQTDFEDALQNAFKAVEAIIGDPPKDDRRFFEKLKNVGIDPLEEVGYQKREAISIVIRRMNEARDKRSAHGSTRQRTIRPAELLHFQACAQVIILAALENARGAAIFV